MSHLLLSVVGNTPQVVTETLFAIHAQGKPWPEQIRIITTTVGKQGALRLINEGVLSGLCHELGVPCPSFQEADILVVPNANGELVADARTADDHEALANFIVTQVRNLTDDTVAANNGRFIHASLAGGRKTMTFYLGYAMSLFGRPGDCLSHVLVSADFENLPDFFYPSRCADQVLTRDGRLLDPSQAVVELADIPFIRHRRNLPGLMKTSSEYPVNFRALIAWINLGENPESLKVCVNTHEQLIQVSDIRGEHCIDFRPGVLEFVFYRMMASATLNRKTDIFRPGSRQGSRTLSKHFCDEMLLTFNCAPGDTLVHAIQALKAWNVMHSMLRESTFESLNQGIKGSWFDQRIHTLKQMFEDQLPQTVINHLLPRIIWTEDGEELLEAKAVKSGAYGLPLLKSSIALV